MTVVWLGCGYTGRVAVELLASRDAEVIATSRDVSSLAGLPVTPVKLDVSDFSELSFVPEGSTVVWSIPSTEPDRSSEIANALADRRPARVIYLSTTGVYGEAAVVVDETTVPEPRQVREQVRAETERAVLQGPWSSLVLRPAAIYGPHRGVHVSVRDRTLQLVGDGSNFVSRIHVVDLAALVTAAVFSDLTGAYPVADDEPCTSMEIARFCAELVGVELPAPVSRDRAHPTRRANRRVDGSAIRKLLKVDLRFPSYRVGIPAALDVESEGK